MGWPIPRDEPPTATAALHELNEMENRIRQHRILLADMRINHTDLMPLMVERRDMIARDAIEFRVYALLRDINLAHLTFPG